MTDDLTKALAELRRVTPPNSPWEAGDIGVGSSPVDYHIATILNAVISGDLIPKADADLAVAWRDGDAVDARLLPALRSGEQADADGCRVIVSREACENAADIIEALTSALAELQALRDERDDAVASQFITRVERDGAEDHATETADELRQVRARAEAADAKVTHLEAHIEGTAKDTQKLLIAAEAELATLRAQVERLTGALRFYADFHENPNDGPWGINSQDFGKEARAALTEGAAP